MSERSETPNIQEKTVREARLKNQAEIERKINSGEYRRGVSPSSRLVEIQNDVFKGIELGKELGIRKTNVKAGDYLAPHFKDLPDLLAKIDPQISKLVTSESFYEDYDYAIRSAALIYTLFIAVHPLRDGNGQSCLNLVYSYLNEANWKISLLPDYKKGAKLKAKGLSLLQTSESPTADFVDIPTTKDESPENSTTEAPKENADKQKIATDLITNATGILWPYLEKYLQTGNPNVKTTELNSTLRGDFWSLVERIDGVNEQLKNSLAGK